MSEVINPFLQASNGKKMLTLIGIYVCTAFAIMHSSGASIVYPMAAGEFDAISGTGEAIKIYSLASSLSGPVSVILMPVWGYIAARSPHLKVPLLAGSVIFGAVVIFVRAISTDIFVFIASGALYGFVSAGVFVVGFMLIRDMFAGAKIGVYMGLIGTMMAVGSLAGPVVTGFVASGFGWRAACHMLWPFFLVGGLMVLMGVRITKQQGEAIANKSGKIDLAGIVCVALFLAPLICGISMGNSFIPFGSVMSYAFFGVAIVSLIALIFIIRKKGDGAIIPVSALKDRNTVMLALSNFFMNFANMFVFFFLPTYVLMVLQPTDLGIDPAGWAGIIMASFAVFGLFLGPIFGRMIAKSGSGRFPLLLGAISRLLFMLFLALFLVPGLSVFILIGLAVVLGGVYSTMGSVHTTSVGIMAPAKLRQQSNAVVQMGQNMGGAPGTAIGGILIATYGVASGMPIAFMVAAAVCVVMFIPILLLKKPVDFEQE